MASTRGGRRFLAPEVVQTSPMDCGPASLKCLLEGHGISVAYGRLREAVQTDVDGTSIDALAEAARGLGLDATELLVPVDHVAHPRARTLPALGVVRLPDGAAHFVVIWRRIGDRVQVMDPAVGRSWIPVGELRRRLYVHTTPLRASTWRRFAGAPHALLVLEDAVARTGHRNPRSLVEAACGDAGYAGLASLEAAARMVDDLVARGGIERGREAARLLESLFERARAEDPFGPSAIPPAYWTARPRLGERGPDPVLLVRGALLVRVLGRDRGAHARQDAGRPALSPELAAALAEPPARPLRAILAELGPRERRTALAVAAWTAVAAATVLAQALVFQALFVLGARFGLDEQRLGVAAALLAFTAGLLLLDPPLLEILFRLGRAIDARWRAAFQQKIPRLPDRWFSSRPSSDMAERAHGLSMLRGLPSLFARGVRTLVQLGFTAAGLVWLDPAAWPFVVLAALAACTVPFAFRGALQERELSLRCHRGALARFTLETLLGTVAVRAHGAEKKIRREHEAHLVEWFRSGRSLARTATLARASVSLAGFGTAVLLVLEHLARSPADPGTLLFAYWALSMPALGDQLAQIGIDLLPIRNATLRALEPITAPSEIPVAESEAAPLPVLHVLRTGPRLKAAGPGPALPIFDVAPTAGEIREQRAASVRISGVDLRLGGQPVLGGIDLAIEPGEHVALVGRSGSGKTSLLGLLLGFHRPTSGRVRVDGEVLSGPALDRLRRTTAWVDPAAQVWNQSLFENLVYGVGSASTEELRSAIDGADLAATIEDLPDGLSTKLGEGGGFLSGGQGQRVRLGRAWLREGVRLALLDEPFRGLDRGTRKKLLLEARRRWSAATLVCAIHDLEETLDFDRVVVLERGSVVADGDPRELLRDPASPYAALLRSERTLLRDLWGSEAWTRWRVDAGKLETGKLETRRVEDEK